MATATTAGGRHPSYGSNLHLGQLPPLIVIIAAAT